MLPRHAEVVKTEDLFAGCCMTVSLHCDVFNGNTVAGVSTGLD
jgi:hypothetical protein